MPTSWTFAVTVCESFHEYAQYTQLVRVFYDSVPKKADESIDELVEGRVTFVVGDVFMHDPP